MPGIPLSYEIQNFIVSTILEIKREPIIVKTIELDSFVLKKKRSKIFHLYISISTQKSFQPLKRHPMESALNMCIQSISHLSCSCGHPDRITKDSAVGACHEE